MSDKDKLSRFYVDESQVEIINDTSLTTDKNGSSSSGNHGHSGRPGMRGGSGGGGGFTNLTGNNSAWIAKQYGFKGNLQDNPDYSEEEKRAMSYYGRVGYEPMNEILRTGFTSDPDDKLARKSLKTMVDMQKQTLPKDTMLYRGAQLDQELSVGDSIGDKAFVSTSFDKTIARDFATEQNNANNKYLFEIKTPKGSKGFFNGQAHDWDEAEWVMDKGREFKIESVSKPDDDGLVTVGVNYE